MKKLMIAAFAVCAAVAANAASFTWSTGDKCFGPNVDFTKLAAGHYGIDSKNKVNPMADAPFTYTYVMTLSNSLGTDDELKGSLTTSSPKSYSLDKIKVQNLSSDAIVNAASGEPNVVVDYSIIITGKYTDAKGIEWTFTSDAIEGKNEYSDIAGLTLMTDAPTGWTITGGADTPEPTSGLLLLLGVAGLALRRRRA